ncbi:MAG: hypothetical protein JNM69_19165 [Archangium sp.]|nr:hypothetical protein [Archangium sp.]
MRRVSLVVVLVFATSAWSQVDAGAELDGGLVEVDAGQPVDAGVSAPAVVTPVLPAPVVQQAVLVPVQKAEEPEKPSAPPIDLSFLLPVTPALSSLFYDFSAVYSRQGFGFAEGPMTLTGLRFIERNSGLGKMTVYFVTQLIMAFGEAAAGSGLVQKHLGTSYGPGYRIDYYQRFSDEEVAAMRRSREATGDSMLSSNMSLDLQLFLPIQGQSTASGISAEITPLTIEFADSGEVGMELAFAYTRIQDPVPGSARLRVYDNLGVPVRFMANWRFFAFQLQWVPNLFGGIGFEQKYVEQNYLKSLEGSSDKPIFYNNSPLSLSVSAHPLRWLFVRATGSWNRYTLDLGSLGFALEAGVRL